MHAVRFRPARLVVTAVAWAALLAAATLSALAERNDSADAPYGLPFAPEGTPASLPELLIDGPLELLPAETGRTEADEDRIEALARFSAARTLERRDRLPEALRQYQRALRYGPPSKTVLEPAIRLAVALDRLDEAVRLVPRVEEPDTLDSMLWMKLGLHLTKKGDLKRAAEMYENALAVRRGALLTAGTVALRLELGRLYYLLSDYPEAADCFAQVRHVLEHPEASGLDRSVRADALVEPAATYALMGECFARADRLDEAVDAFEASHRAQPDKGLLGYHLAQVEARNDRPARALAKLESYFKERASGEGVAPYRLLAELLEKLGNRQEFIERLKELRAKDPENVPLGYALAEAYREAERFDEAESLYRELAEKTPTLTGYRALVALCRRADRPEALLDVIGQAAVEGVAPESFTQEERSIADDADLVRTLIELGRKRHQSAPDGLEFGPALGVAMLALEAERPDAAGEFFERAVAADADRASETLLTWGLGLLAQDEHESAIGVLRRGIDEKLLADDNPAVYFYLSGALELAGRTDEALAAARKAVELDPQSPRFLSRVAWILYRNERHEEAADAYRRLLEAYDAEFGSAEIRQVIREARLVLSNLAVLAGDFDEAERRLEEVLDEFPDDVGALNDLGYLWADRNVHLHRAHDMLRRAVEGDPENAAYRDSLGWVLFRLGRHQQAVAELEKAAAGSGDDEPDPVILDHLGDAYRAAGKTDRAVEAWKQALKQFKERNDADMAKKVQQKLADNR